MMRSLRLLMAILLLGNSVPLPAFAAGGDLLQWSALVANNSAYFCKTAKCSDASKIPAKGAPLYVFTKDEEKKVVTATQSPYRLFVEGGKLFVAKADKKDRVPIPSTRPVEDVSVALLKIMKVDIPFFKVSVPNASPRKNRVKDKAKDTKPAPTDIVQPLPAPAKAAQTLDDAIAEAYPKFSKSGQAAAKCYLQWSKLEADFIDKDKRKKIDLKKQEAEITRLVGVRLTNPEDIAKEKAHPDAEAFNQCLGKIPGLLEHYCTSDVPSTTTAEPPAKDVPPAKADAPAKPSLDQRCKDWRFEKAYPDENERKLLACVATPEEIAKTIGKDCARGKSLDDRLALHSQHILLGKDAPKVNKLNPEDPITKKQLECLRNLKLEDKLKNIYCKNEQPYDVIKNAGKAVDNKDEALKDQAKLKDQERVGDLEDVTNRMDSLKDGGGVDIPQYPPAQEKLRNDCKKVLALQPGGTGPGLNDRGAGNLTIDPKDKRDIEKEKKDAERKELMTNLKKDAIAGAFGAAGFGILGFIFGGPFGALIGGAIGFGLMAGVTHLNNNPIK